MKNRGLLRRYKPRAEKTGDLTMTGFSTDRATLTGFHSLKGNRWGVVLQISDLPELEREANEAGGSEL